MELTWQNASQFHCDGIPFWTPLLDGDRSASPARLQGMQVFKTRELIEKYLPIFENPAHRNVVEIGIHQGGSTALMGIVGGFDRLVSLELNQERIPELDQFIAQHDLGERVKPYFGVDQADSERLDEILQTEFGDQGIDLVIDDASHRLHPTRASFDAIFPRLAPGALYIIEDWAGLHALSRGMREKRIAQGGPAAKPPTTAEDRMRRAVKLAKTAPLTIFATELSLAMIEHPDVFSSLVVDPYWLALTKGPASPPLTDDSRFRLENCYVDDFGLVAVPPQRQSAHAS